MQIKTFLPTAADLNWEISQIANHFHVTCVDPSGLHRGSGFHLNRAIAKKIAFIELNERYMVDQIYSNSTLKREWMLDYDGSCSGFAAGYDRNRTWTRSFLESVERWALTKWADENYAIPQINVENSDFLNVEIRRFFQCNSSYVLNLPLLYNNNRILSISVAVFLGWTSEGVFAGYGTKENTADAISHAQIEAYRNFVIHKNQPARDEFPYNRISYFATNRSVAEKAILKKKEKVWPSPKIKLSKHERIENLWLARTILSDWEPWQSGQIERFLY